MRYLKETSLYDFPAWSGGADTLEVLKENGDVDSVEEYINEISEGQEEPMTETEVNDLLWFERDAIAEYLGYSGWDAYEYGEEEEEEEEEDDDWDDEECDEGPEEQPDYMKAVVEAVKKVEEIVGFKIM